MNEKILNQIKKYKLIMITVFFLLVFFLMFNQGINILLESNRNAYNSYKVSGLLQTELTLEHYLKSYLIRGFVYAATGAFGLLLTTNNFLKKLS